MWLSINLLLTSRSTSVGTSDPSHTVVSIAYYILFQLLFFFTGAICRPLLICTDRSFMTTTCFPQCQKAKSVYSECSKAGKGEKKAVIGKKGKQDDHLNMSRRQSSKAFMAMRSLVHMKSDKIVLKKSLREKFKPRFLHCISDGVQSSDKRFIWSRLMPSMWLACVSTVLYIYRMIMLCHLFQAHPGSKVKVFCSSTAAVHSLWLMPDTLSPHTGWSSRPCPTTLRPCSPVTLERPSRTRWRWKE